MQKKIIALAVAGLVSGAAFAQSSVTVYGKVVQAYVYEKSDYKKFSGIEDNAIGGDYGLGSTSRLGFRGEEGLGGGLKAIFQYEWGVATETGGGPTAPRYTYVGLSGNFGTVVAGRVQKAHDKWGGVYNVQGTTGLETANLFKANFRLLNPDRIDNAVAYWSPNFNGFVIDAAYGFGEKVSGNKQLTGGYGTPAKEKADLSDGAQYSIGLRYDNGPLKLAAIYEALLDDDSTTDYNSPTNAGRTTGYKGWNIGGSYDFKVVKVYANIQKEKANHSPTGDVGSDKQQFWTVGLNVPVTSKSAVSFEYGQYKDYLDNRGGFTNLGNNDPEHKAKGYTLGYSHLLSKRTQVFANATYLSNDRGIAAGRGNATTTKTIVGGENQKIFTAGIAHTF